MPKGGCTPIFLPRAPGGTEQKESTDLLVSSGEKVKQNESMDRPVIYSVCMCYFRISGLPLLRERKVKMSRKKDLIIL